MKKTFFFISQASMIRVGLLCLTLFCVFSAMRLQAQTDETALRRKKRTSSLIDEYNANNTHDPRRALRMSAMLPGAGQVYNRQAWKIPIIYAVIGGVGYYTYYNFTHMRDYKDEYLYRVNHEDIPQNSDFVNIPTANVYNLYQAYNKSFQLSIIICAAVYGLNMVDAYVFAHLFDFQIDDDISLNIAPSVVPLGIADGYRPLFSPAATLSIRF